MNSASGIYRLEGQIRHPGDLPPRIRLTEAERAFFARCVDSLPFAVTPYYLSLIDPQDPEDPIRLQCLPRRDEGLIKPYELEDPLGAGKYAVYPRLIHQYRDRALLLVTDRCASYCRHCFRRRFSGRQNRLISSEELEQAARYLGRHREIREIIFSGGDPFLLSDERLIFLIRTLRKARPGLAVRIHTRMPVVLPERFGRATVQALAQHLPLRIISQFNHPRELASSNRQVAARFRAAEIPVLNQAVLLRGVNDRPDTLEALFRSLARAGIKPYYLFQGDLAPGTAHFRVPLRAGLALIREIEARVPKQALPTYALDLPGGGGKIPLSGKSVLASHGDWLILAGPRGGRFKYPRIG